MLAIVGVVLLLLIGIVVLVALGSVDTSDDKPVAAPRPATPAAPSAPAPTAAPAEPDSDDGDKGGLSAEEAKARQAALAQVRAQGFRPVDPDQWQPGNRLRVLTGRATKASGKQGMLAFFFLGEDYLGTDTRDPSAKIAVGKQGDSTIALRYTTFKPDDEACCPSGEQVTVRYRYTGGKLVPQEDIPPPDARQKSGG